MRLAAKCTRLRVHLQTRFVELLGADLAQVAALLTKLPLFKSTNGSSSSNLSVVKSIKLEVSPNEDLVELDAAGLVARYHGKMHIHHVEL
jgi:hypothetical protein